MTRFAVWILLVGTLVFAGCQAGAQSDSASSERPDAVPGERPTSYPDRIALTWSEDPATSLSVTWRTDPSVDEAVAQVALARAEPSFYTEAETVEASTELLDLSKIQGEYVTAHYHSATFSGLMPDTLYAYRVGDGERWSEWFHARTASDQPEPMSFIYFGDAQNNLRSHWSRAIRAAYQHAPDARFIIHAGDLVDNAHRNIEWGEWHQAGGFIHAMLPSVPVPGNHEHDAFEKWTEPGTFRLAARVEGDAMEGTVVEPDGDTEPFTATRSSGTSNASDASNDPAGSWEYVVDNNDYSGTLQLTRSNGQLTGTIVNATGSDVPRPDRSFTVDEIAVTGDSLTARFQLEVEKEGEEHLSAHWRPGFTLPMNGARGFKESTYYMDIQGVRIVGLNSDPATGGGEALAVQTAWLDSVLTNTPNQWTVVTFHHPVFSSSEGRDNPEIRAAWKPLFDEHRVDLVLQGHDHTYARGQAENLTQGVNTRSPVGGTVYVNSVSGAKMYALKKDEWDTYEPIDLARAAENTQLFQVIRIDGDTLRFRAYTVTGQLYDAFELVKDDPDGPSTFTALMDAGATVRTHDNTISYERP
jgi:hypothetical protein